MGSKKPQTQRPLAQEPLNIGKNSAVKIHIQPVISDNELRRGSHPTPFGFIPDESNEKSGRDTRSEPGEQLNVQFVTDGDKGRQREMSPTAKVSAWLETVSSSLTIEDDEEDLMKRPPIDCTDGGPSRPHAQAPIITATGSLHLKPLDTELNPRDQLEVEKAFVRRAIPPIIITELDGRTYEQGEGTGGSGKKYLGTNVGLSDDESNSNSSRYCAEDILTNAATIDSSTTYTVLSDHDDHINTVTQDASEGHVTPRQVYAQLQGGTKEEDTVLVVREKDDTAPKLSSLINQKPLSVAGPSTAKDVAEASNEGRSSLKVGTVVTSLMQWKLTRKRVAKRRKESIAVDARHQTVMNDISDKIKTQLPRSLSYSIKEEVYHILVNTVQAYKSEIGSKHRLTVQAQTRLEELIKEIVKPH